MSQRGGECMRGVAIRAACYLGVVALAILAVIGFQTVIGGGSKEYETQTLSVSGQSLTFLDQIGTQTNQFEMLIAGTPATFTATVTGCMRGNTCVAVGSYTGTANATITVLSGPFDKYLFSATWTGGASPSVQVNRTGTVSRKAYGPFTMDTRLFAGADAGIRAQNCFAFIAQNINALGGVCDERLEQGTLANSNVVAWSVNPFGGCIAPNAPVLLLGQATYTFDVPTVVATRPPPCANFGNGQAKMIGVGVGEQPGGVVQGGTTLLASASFQACRGTNVITWNASTFCPGNAATVTVTTNGDGTATVTASSAIFTRLDVGCNLASPEAGGAADSWGQIGAVTSPTVAVLSQNNNLNQNQAAGTSFVEWCSGVALAATSQLYPGNHASYSVQVINMSVDMNNVLGANCIQNWYAVEQSYFQNIVCQGTTGIGMDVESNQPQSSGDYMYLFFGEGTNCVNSTRDVVIYTGNSSPRQLRNISAANGHGCNGATAQQDVAIDIKAGIMALVSIHCENKSRCIAVDDGTVSACPVLCPNAVTQLARGLIIEDINGSCSNGSCNGGMIELGSSPGAPIDISIRSIAQSVANWNGNTLVDLNNVITVTDTTLQEYNLGHTGLPVRNTSGQGKTLTVGSTVILNACIGTIGAANGGIYFLNGISGTCNVLTSSPLHMPMSGTMVAFYVDIFTPPTTNTAVTLIRNGGATAITCTVLAAAHACADIAHAVTFTAGDNWNIQAVPGQAAETSANIRVTAYVN